MIQLELIMGIETLQVSPFTIPLRQTLGLLHELITPLQPSLLYKLFPRTTYPSLPTRLLTRCYSLLLPANVSSTVPLSIPLAPAR